jgi:hypothetical protein
MVGLLICTLIYENQCLEKSKSISDPRKMPCSENLDFFQVWHQDGELKKYQGLQLLKFF